MKIPLEIATNLEELVKWEHLIHDFNLLPNQPVRSMLSGKHASKLRGRGLDFAEVRQYVRGDDVRNIDWKVTARTKVPHSKVFTEEKERPTFLIVDQSTSMFFASSGSMKSVIAAQVAAISGFKVLQSGDRIGGLVFDDEEYEVFQPKRNRSTLLRFLELVAQKNQNLVQRKKVQSKNEIINKALFNAQNLVTHDYVVVVISDFQKLNEQGRQYMTNLTRHNEVIMVLISDQMEMNIPNVKMPVGNGEQQILLKGTKKSVGKFNDLSSSIREDNIEYCRKFGIPLLELNTKSPVAEQIRKYFGNR